MGGGGDDTDANSRVPDIARTETTNSDFLKENARTEPTVDEL